MTIEDHRVYEDPSSASSKNSQETKAGNLQLSLRNCAKMMKNWSHLIAKLQCNAEVTPSNTELRFRESQRCSPFWLFWDFDLLIGLRDPAQVCLPSSRWSAASPQPKLMWLSINYMQPNPTIASQNASKSSSPKTSEFSRVYLKSPSSMLSDNFAGRFENRRVHLTHHPMHVIWEVNRLRQTWQGLLDCSSSRHSTCNSIAVPPSSCPSYHWIHYCLLSSTFFPFETDKL